MSYNFPDNVLDRIVHYGQLAQTRPEILEEGNLGSAFAAIQVTAQLFLSGDADAYSLLMANCMQFNIEDRDITQAVDLLDGMDEFEDAVEFRPDQREALEAKVAVIASFKKMDELYGKIYDSSEDPSKGKNPDGSPDLQWGEKHLYDDLPSLEVALLSMQEDCPDIAAAFEAMEESAMTPPPSTRSPDPYAEDRQIRQEQNQEYIDALNADQRVERERLQMRIDELEARVIELEVYKERWDAVKKQFSFVPDVKGFLEKLEKKDDE